MKLHLLASLVLATSSFTVAAGDDAPVVTIAPSDSAAKTPEEKKAIERFKGEIDGVTQWIEEKQKTAVADPAAGIALVKEIVTKFQSIKTDGLPADLKGAWGEMSGVMGEMGEIFKGMPTAKPDKPEEAMRAMADLIPKMMAIQAKMEPAAKKLDEVGKKYGLDMSKVAPSQ